MRRTLPRLLLSIVASAGPAAAASIQFDPPRMSPLLGGAFGAEPLALADVNLDGVVDAIVTGPAGVQVLLGRSGSFDPFATVGFGPAHAIATGDLNHDGIPDLVIAFDDGSVQFFTGRGDGFFDERLAFSNGIKARWIALADIGGDGNLDAVAAYPDIGQVLVFTGDGTGGFTVVNSAGGARPAQALALGDLDNDGFVDAATADDTGVSEYHNFGGSLFFSNILDSSGGPAAIALADIDPRVEPVPTLDILIAGSFGTIDMMRNRGGDVFAPRGPAIFLGGTANALAVGDFDVDGIPDVAATDTSGQFYAARGRGDASFEAPFMTFVGRCSAIAVADVDNDGLPDVVGVDPASSSLDVLINRTARADQPPMAVNDHIGTDEDTAVALDVCANDFDPDTANNLLRVVPGSLTQPAHGSVVLNGDGRTVNYMPAANYNGSDSFSYQVTDGTLQSSTPGIVTIDIAAVNDAPVNTALPAITVATSKPLTLRASTGTWNDSADGGGTHLTFAYQWQRATSPGALPADIAGATSSTYATTSADSGKYLRVKVTATDDGIPGSAASSSSSEYFAGSAPANDDFNKATVLSGTSGSAAGTNIVATKQSGEPNHAGDAAGHSVWWTWKAPMKQGGTLTIDTGGSDFDTVLAAYTGNKVNALTLKAQNDNAIGAQSRISFTVQANTTYLIAVDGAASAANPTTGAIVLHWSFSP